MRKRSRKPEPDTNEIAASIVAQVSGQPPLSSPEARPSKATISAVAAEMGRRGGLKGGPARKRALSATKRLRIAKKAAWARWGKKRHK